MLDNTAGVSFESSDLGTNNFIVDSSSDVVDDSDGLTTLREAISAANSLSGQNTIDFNLASGSVIELTGQLDIVDDLIVNGLGAENLTISGNSTFNNLFIDSANVAIKGLTFANARDSISIGSGVNLTVADSSFSANTDDAIDVTGNSNTVSVFHTALSNNGTTETPDGGGLEINGSLNTIALDGVNANDNIEDGVFINADNNTLTVKNSSFSGNTDDGIDVNTNNNTVEVIDTAFSNNGTTETPDGGGIEIGDAGRTDIGNFNTVTLDGVNADNNIQDGLLVNGGDNTLTVENSSFSGNTDDGIDVTGNSNTVGVIDTALSNNGTTETPDGGGMEIGGSFNTIALDGVNANDNIEDGVFINADNNTLTVENSSFSGNTDDGIDVNTNNNTVGVVDTALSNNGTTETPDGGGIEIGDAGRTDIGNFNTVTLDGVNADNNIQDGLLVNGGDNTLTVKNSSFSANTDDGIDVSGNSNTVSVFHTALSNNGTTETPDGGGMEINGSFNTIGWDGVSANNNIEYGLLLDVPSFNNDVILNNSTFSDNSVGNTLNLGTDNTLTVI